MKKFKNFILNLFKKIKLWFILHKPLLIKILLLIYVFCFGLCVGGCIEFYINLNCNSNQYETIDTCSANDTLFDYGYVISDNSTKCEIEMGDLSQYFVSFADDIGTNYSVYYKTISLPFILEINDMDSITTMNFRIKFGVIGAGFNIPNNGKYYKGLKNLVYANANKRNDYVSNALVYNYRAFNDFVPYEDAQVIRYCTNNIGYNDFGFDLAILLDRNTQGTNGVANSYFIEDPAWTYFMFATNRRGIEDYIPPTRLTSLYIDYWEYYYVDNSSLGSNVFANGDNVYMTYWCTYNYSFDNGLKVAFGMPIFIKYPNNPNPFLPYDKMYSYFDDTAQSAYNNGFNEGWNLGVSEGYSQGVNESINSISPFNAVVTFVNNLLSIKLFGNVSLGTIISVVFGFVIFGVLIKVFLGG